MKFYKYTSMSNAIKIIKSGSVILNNPKNFNDPFDTNLIIDEKDKRKALDLMYNYYLFKSFKELINREDIKLSKRQKALFTILKKECSAYDFLLKKTTEYTKIANFNKGIKIIEKNNPEFEKLVDDFEKGFEDIIKNAINQVREKMLITCFSKRNDSILMWSHYGNSHTGVCFEFEDDRNIFQDVVYSEKRPHLCVENLVARYLICDYKKEKFDFKDDAYFKDLMNLFFIKQKDWKYEQEIRCILSEEDKDVVYNEDKYFLRMNISKIYIGTKACGENLNDLIKRANNRGIPVVFMQEDPKLFKIIPNYEKKFDCYYQEKENLPDLFILKNEINQCLDSNCYLAALSLALNIPSILGKIKYPNLNEKDSFIKWYQENIGYFETDEEDKKDRMPYASGELIYKLRTVMQNNWNMSVEGTYDEFELTKLILILEKKNKFDMYCGEASVGNDFNGELKSELQINIRDFCKKILYFLDKDVKENLNLSKTKTINLRDFDKEKDNLDEIVCLNKTINNKIRNNSKKIK